MRRGGCLLLSAYCDKATDFCSKRKVRHVKRSIKIFFGSRSPVIFLSKTFRQFQYFEMFGLEKRARDHYQAMAGRLITPNTRADTFTRVLWPTFIPADKKTIFAEVFLIQAATCRDYVNL